MKLCEQGKFPSRNRAFIFTLFFLSNDTARTSMSDLRGSQTTRGECTSWDDVYCSWVLLWPPYRPYWAANIADWSGMTAGAAAAWAGEHAT